MNTKFTTGTVTVPTKDGQDTIHYRSVGSGSTTLVLVPGNNTSGAIFEPLMEQFQGDLGKNYTLIALDYRGSGKSSYNSTITSLTDFASDFENALKLIPHVPESQVILVGYSMGFAVALEMTILNKNRYSKLVGLAPVGTRGVRVDFNDGTAGTDGLGNSYGAGDRVPTTNVNIGIEATKFHQRAWQGDARTQENVSMIWNMLVLNDLLKFNIGTFEMGNSEFTTTPAYQAQIDDVMNIQYMPHSLYYTHTFNVSKTDVVKENSDGTIVTIKGDNRLNNTKLDVLLVKAQTDFVNWRGDQVIYDNYIATSKYDLKQAGATVSAVLIHPDFGYDHGFPTVKAAQTAAMIDGFIRGEMKSAKAVESALGDGTTVQFYPHDETDFETDVFTGF